MSRCSCSCRGDRHPAYHKGSVGGGNTTSELSWAILLPPYRTKPLPPGESAITCDGTELTCDDAILTGDTVLPCEGTVLIGDTVLTCDGYNPKM